jgi:hypothetical protein
MSTDPIIGERQSPSVVAKVGELVIAAVDKAVITRWESAQVRAGRAKASSHEGRLDEVARAFAQELAAAGAMSGGLAAAPGVGTGAAIASASAEVSWTTVRLGDLVLTVAALHGHDQPSVEERRAWVLAVLAGGSAMTGTATALAKEMGKGLGAKATKKIPTAALQALNRTLGRTVVTKYGTKRGAIALGRLLPFGVGAAIGGGLNYATVRVIARRADRFFQLLSAQAVDSPADEDQNVTPDVDS